MEGKLDRLLREVVDQARSLDIPVSQQLEGSVRVSARAVRRLGVCRWEEGHYVIQVAARLLQAPEGLIRQILAHEALHTCPGCMNHGPSWKLYAQKMNQAYGYQISRLTPEAQLPLLEPKGQYLLRCIQCGAQFTRMRRSKLIQHPERYRCRCGGVLQRVR